MTNKSEYDRINITMPPDVRDKLDVLSKVHRRSKSNMISYLIDVAYEDLPSEKQMKKKKG